MSDMPNLPPDDWDMNRLPEGGPLGPAADESHAFASALDAAQFVLAMTGYEGALILVGFQPENPLAVNIAGHTYDDSRVGNREMAVALEQAAAAYRLNRTAPYTPPGI